MHMDPPFYLEATGPLHYEMDYKRSGILTVLNGFRDSAFLELVKLQEKSLPEAE